MFLCWLSFYSSIKLLPYWKYYKHRTMHMSYRSKTYTWNDVIFIKRSMIRVLFFVTKFVIWCLLRGLTNRPPAQRHIHAKTGPNKRVLISCAAADARSKYHVTWFMLMTYYRMRGDKLRRMRIVTTLSCDSWWWRSIWCLLRDLD